MAASDWHPEVYKFAEQMDRQLRDPGNRDKGDWTEMEPGDAVSETFYHVAKLHKAVERLVQSGETPEPLVVKALMEFAADVGNHAMIVADVCNALDADPDYAEQAEKTVGWDSGASYFTSLLAKDKPWRCRLGLHTGNETCPRCGWECTKVKAEKRTTREWY